MSALPPGETRRLIRRTPRASASLALLISLGVLVTSTTCGGRDRHEVARGADHAYDTGIFTWLSDHDPSALVVDALPIDVTRTVAPDARVMAATDIAGGCRQALRNHALFAVRVRARTPARDRAQDCGYTLYRDATALVIAPR